jgi:hypothetical protein
MGRHSSKGTKTAGFIKSRCLDPASTPLKRIHGSEIMGWTLKRSANYTSARLHMWLWCSHALPAGTRLRSKDANSACPHCGEIEVIRHMTYDCMVAAYIRYIVSKWVMRSTFESAIFNEDNTTMAVAARTLNDLATFYMERWVQCPIWQRYHAISDHSQ